MSSAKLTKRTIDEIMPLDRPRIVYDQELKGFGIRVMPSGRKAWIVEFRPNGGGRKVPTKRITLGGATLLTPEQARRAARDILAAVCLGQDPAAERKKSRETPTVCEFLEQYLIAEAEPKLKPGTVPNYRTYFRKHVIPAVGSLKISAVSAADVAILHRRIGAGTPVTANRVVEALSTVFRYGATAGVVEQGFNPTTGISMFREAKRERFLSTTELQRLGTTVRAENLDSVILVMKVAENRSRCGGAEPLNRPMNGRVLAQSPMSSRFIVVGGKLAKEPAQMGLTEHNQGGRDIPVGSCRSVSPRTHSARASPEQWVCRGMPMARNRRANHRYNWRKDRRSLFVNRTRPRTWR